MHELMVNLHMHTIYSDGSGRHKDLARAALKTGLDAVIVTDHNVLVSGLEGYYRTGDKRVLMLVGEEVHDQARDPQRNHLLVFDAKREMAVFASNPQNLIDNVRGADGLCFVAHPYDLECRPAGEIAIRWEDWGALGYTGLELWNGLSELKEHGHSLLHILFYSFFPAFLAQQPPRASLDKWDELTAEGGRIVAIGGSDAHALHVRRGPLRRILFPYEFHFKAINTHILVPNALSGDVEADGKMIYAALAAGHAFVGYDLPGSTRGFRFTAQGRETSVIMGDEIAAAGSGVTLKAQLPHAAECTLLRNGKAVQKWKSQENCSYVATRPGVYRVEVHRQFLGKRRGWIYSNPIYVR
jgi:hypothetical protein